MAKSRVAIVVDSTATLPRDLVEKYNLRVIPQCLNWEGDTLLDGIDITPEQFYARLGTSRELPTTSQPSAGEFHEFFQNVAETSESIVAVLVSSEFSGTIASAMAAKEMMPDYPLEIVDTRSVSMGLGFMAVEAARAVERGLSHFEVAQAARALIPKMRIVFVVDTLEYLHKGGRIGGARRLLGSVLSIKPLLHVENGRIEELGKARTKRKALLSALETVENDMKGKSSVRAAVIHASAPEEAEEFAEQLGQRVTLAESRIAELSPVVGTHVGPGLVGVAYYSDTE